MMLAARTQAEGTVKGRYAINVHQSMLGGFRHQSQTRLGKITVNSLNFLKHGNQPAMVGLVTVHNRK